MATALQRFSADTCIREWAHVNIQSLLICIIMHKLSVCFCVGNLYMELSTVSLIVCIIKILKKKLFSYHDIFSCHQ